MTEQYQQTKSMMLALFDVAAHASQTETISTSLIEAQQALLSIEQLFSGLTEQQQVTEQPQYHHLIGAASDLNLTLIKSLDHNNLTYADQIQTELTALEQLI